MTKRLKAWVVIAPALLSGLCACEKPQVSSYAVKKPTVPHAATTPPTATPTPQPPQDRAEVKPGAVTPAEGPWPAPAGWRLLPEAKPMRLATFQAGEGANGLEIVLSEFPGDAGGLLPNINRWRTQLALPPATLEQVQAESSRIDSPPVSGYVVHLRGDKAHMLGAVLHDTRAGRTRFLKATGAPAAIEVHKPAFEQFARSLASMKEGG